LKHCRFSVRTPEVFLRFSVPFVDFTTTKTSGVRPKYSHPGILIDRELAYDSITKRSHHFICYYIYCSGARKHFEETTADGVSTGKLKSRIITLALEKPTYCDPKRIMSEDCRRQFKTQVSHESGAFGSSYVLQNGEREKISRELDLSYVHICR
jgi:hypothetical protein